MQQAMMAEMMGRAPEAAVKALEFGNKLRDAYKQAKKEGSDFSQVRRSLYNSYHMKATVNKLSDWDSIKNQIEKLELSITLLEADLFIYRIQNE
ncbi:hypothetical protein [Jeotgalibacillus soli]|uniref:Uncharacterized protein n=1 Tax=Jeotgalibacillus soli TaxID=889306 RepID=A0A0C2VM00_9BACL|nr:hypothetical protein [Jeotgalibacillus soli]KIL45008.1 hypothetical protein KP78_25520 [Jeotgalibacillus soli]